MCRMCTLAASLLKLLSSSVGEKALGCWLQSNGSSAGPSEPKHSGWPAQEKEGKFMSQSQLSQNIPSVRASVTSETCIQKFIVSGLICVP